MAEPARKPDEEISYLRPIGAEEPASEKLPNSGKAIAGFVMSLLSLVVFGVIFGFLGALYGGFGLAEINRGERSGKGLAMAAIAIGGLSFVFSLIYLALMVSGRLSTTLNIQGGVMQRLL